MKHSLTSSNSVALSDRIAATPTTKATQNALYFDWHVAPVAVSN
ncbi:MAG: hypothetical protein K0R17_1835 [Rariglobus sp.]|jgi:hypothetical protein|nr:hypothetical protein [Rariglobus sp.]